MTRRTIPILLAALVAPLALSALPAPPASAAATHVGLVVRFADGNVRTACATAGGSGLAVLERKFTVQVGQAPPYAGFVFTINGTGTTHPDTTHYWSYWHSSNGGWVYSSTGAGSYTPKAGTVEGWSYVNGTNTAPKPPVHSYASLCASSDPKPRTQPAPSRTTATRTTAAPHPRSATPTRQAARTPGRQPDPSHATRSPSPATATPPSRAPSRSAAPTSAAPTRRATSSTSATRPSTTPASASSASAAISVPATTRASSLNASPASADQQASSGFPAWGTALALVAVAAIGVTAWLLTRRRPN